MYLFQIFSIIGSLVLFGVVIDFIRRGLLKEKYSVLWLAAAAFVMILSVKRSILDFVAGIFGVAYPPSLLFLVAFLFVLLILLHFSVVISIFHEKNKILSQEIVLLRHTLKETLERLDSYAGEVVKAETKRGNEGDLKVTASGPESREGKGRKAVKGGRKTAAGKGAKRGKTGHGGG